MRNHGCPASRADAGALCAGRRFLCPTHIAPHGGISFPKPETICLKLTGQSLAVIFVVMAASRFLAFCVDDADNFPKSNFCYTAYGVVHYQNWYAAMENFGTDRDKINKAVFKRIKQVPSSVPIGMWRGWKVFFQESYGYCFMGHGYTVLFQSLAIRAFILACFRKLPAYPLVLALGAGLGASIPFVPPADADGMRVYAATIPLHALIAALGAGALDALVSSAFRKGARAAAESPDGLGEMRRDGFASVALSAVVVVLAFIIPITRCVYFPPTVRNRSFPRVAERPAGMPTGSYFHLIAMKRREPGFAN